MCKIISSKLNVQLELIMVLQCMIPQYQLNSSLSCQYEKQVILRQERTQLKAHDVSRLTV